MFLGGVGAFRDAGTHKMPFLVPGDCLPGRRCQAVCLLCSINSLL